MAMVGWQSRMRGLLVSPNALRLGRAQSGALHYTCVDFEKVSKEAEFAVTPVPWESVRGWLNVFSYCPGYALPVSPCL